MGETKKASLAKRQKMVKEAVFSILEKYPETRSSDRKLLLRYWSEVDKIPFDYTFPQRFIESGTTPESITRARRHIQRTGLFKPEEEVAQERKERETGMKSFYSTQQG